MMKVSAIIAEYNPFHAGHAYQLSQIKADFVMAIMSGNYVQRGEPALLDKWTRAEIALKNGVDLVLELPTSIATGSAEFFAKGAIFLLDGTKVVQELCFGAEHEEIQDFYPLVSVLESESPEFSRMLKHYLKKGFSFPAAREKAIRSVTDTAVSLKESNNILALEYLRALQYFKSKISPALIPRKGQRYLDTAKTENTLLSASAVRACLEGDHHLEELEPFLPQPTYAELLKKNERIFPKDLYSSLQYLFLRHPLSDFLHLREANLELFQRLEAGLSETNGYEEWISFCQSRNFPISKIKRTLLYLYLHQQEPCALKKEFHYLRILGFRKKALPLLRKLQNHSEIPVLTNTRHSKNLCETAYLEYLKQCRYDNLYHYLVQQKYHVKAQSEAKKKPIQI